MIFSSLVQYYERLAARGKLPAFGLTQEKISFALVLARDGALRDIQDIRTIENKKPRWALLTVPASFKRPGSSPPSFFLWDKTAFVLGIENKTGADSPTLNLKSHATFRRLHLDRLAEATDEGLVALRRFIEAWNPEHWAQSPLVVKNAEALCAANLVFRLDGELGYIHDRPAAREMVARFSTIDDAVLGTCLVSGQTRPIARLHPAIKGVSGAQSSGASIVSFNLDAFDSYGKAQGSNAPVSAQAAFAYTTVLNHLLQRGPHHRQCTQIGDASVVFWADAEDAEEQEAAEMLFGLALDPSPADETETATLGHALELVRQRLPIKDLDPHLDPQTKLYVLGLAPNASRLSIRYWITGTLIEFAQRLSQHYYDLHIDPAPWKTPPNPWRLLTSLAAQEKTENISPLLAGTLMRAVLTGGRYPRTLLSAAIVRMRADGQVTGLRVALCKAVLARDQRLGDKDNQQEIPVSLDRNNPAPSYRLGRLFSVLESIQEAALGKVSATIKDRYYGSASATPTQVFPLLMRGAQNHLAKAMKSDGMAGLAQSLEIEASRIIDGLGNEFPKMLSLEDQGRFAIGYYHQRSERFRSKADKANNAETQETIDDLSAEQS
jgi:CRISPR-associated protein Csd1